MFATEAAEFSSTVENFSQVVLWDGRSSYSGGVLGAHFQSNQLYIFKRDTINLNITFPFDFDFFYSLYSLRLWLLKEMKELFL